MFNSLSQHHGHGLKSPALRAASSLLLAGAMAALLPAVAAASVPFHVLDNPADPNFNQLLGINDGGVIVGYFGDGNVIANNGYVLVPQNHYAVDNFTNLPSGDTASQTQAIGINNRVFPDIVGFYTDALTGFTNGFLDASGVQTTIDDPAGTPPNVAATNQNLLGINDRGKAAGFWIDNQNLEHGFVVVNIGNPASRKFVEIPPRLFPGAVATQASGINDHDDVCGFWTDAKGSNHGFYGHLGGIYRTFNVRLSGVKVISTSAFGCNDRGEIVGSFTDAKGAVHGFTDRGGRFTRYDAPGSSQFPAFNVSGTLVNGVDEEGDIVGFFSDGTKVDGFVRIATAGR